MNVELKEGKSYLTKNIAGMFSTYPKEVKILKIVDDYIKYIFASDGNDETKAQWTDKDSIEVIVEVKYEKRKRVAL